MALALSMSGLQLTRQPRETCEKARVLGCSKAGKLAGGLFRL